MLREFAWRSFEYTGNIDSYMFYREIGEKRRALKESYTASDEVAISNSIPDTVLA